MLAGLRLLRFSYLYISEIFKSTLFYKTPPVAASILYWTFKLYQGTKQFIKDIKEMFFNILSNRYSVPYFFEIIIELNNHYLFVFFLLLMFQTFGRLHIFVGKK